MCTATSGRIGELAAAVAATPTGARLRKEESERAAGGGPPHTDASLRLFGQSESAVRVTLFRDTAAWCPYCQKVWLLLEEKRVPYRIEKINMRSYGDKPAEYLRKVPNGLLPAMEIDGQFMTDSIPIMLTIDAEFAEYGPRMVPPPGSAERERAEALLRLERELFRDWCSLTFQPGTGLFGASKKGFEATLHKVDAALGEKPGPWFLGGDAPSLVDLQYVSHVERMVASVAYWKGMRLRDPAIYPNLCKWLDAFEARPAYLATKSDMYTHVRDIPPQYGPGFSIGEADNFAKAISGKDGSWELPFRALDPDFQFSLDPAPPLLVERGEEAARHEAAYKLLGNFDAVVRFAARATGAPGVKRFQAPLADPYAQSDDAMIDPVGAALRHVATALLRGTDVAGDAAVAELGATGSAARDLISCLEYLRERIGVPRDMSGPAAIALRAHLNWAIRLVK